MSPTNVQDDAVVHFFYTLSDADGNVIDSNRSDEAMPYLHGAGNIVPGLEKQMTGHAVGDSFNAVVSAEEGYGVRDQELVAVPRDQFPPDADLQVGMQIMAEDTDGHVVPLWIAALEDGIVVVDPNHPLADVELHFAIEITEIRNATSEELAHGHPHGPGGAHAH